MRILAGVLGLGFLLTLIAWAFLARIHPDRVGDFASFLQMCTTLLTR